MKNVFLRWAEHEDPNQESERAKHLKYFRDHKLEWEVLAQKIREF